jgi:hypothetical protein
MSSVILFCCSVLSPGLTVQLLKVLFMYFTTTIVPGLFAELLPELRMLPEEEPEQQLLHVSEGQVDEHLAAKKAAADKAAGAAAGGLGGFAGAKAGSRGKQAAADKKATGGATTVTKPAGSTSSGGASQHIASEASVAACTLSHAQLRKLHVERQRLLGEWKDHDRTAGCHRFGQPRKTCRNLQLQQNKRSKAMYMAVIGGNAAKQRQCSKTTANTMVLPAAVMAAVVL